MTNNLQHFFGNSHGLDEKSIDFLIQALHNANLPGFDYLEFKQSLNALAKMHLDEEMSIKSAFATAATVGLTKAKLLETANHYKNIIAKEKEKFDAALRNQQVSRVESKQAEQQKLKAKIVANREQITKLQEEIIALEKTVVDLDTEIKTDGEKLEAQKAKYEQAHHSVINMFDKDIAGIEKYITE